MLVKVKLNLHTDLAILKYPMLGYLTVDLKVANKNKLINQLIHQLLRVKTKSLKVYQVNVLIGKKQ